MNGCNDFKKRGWDAMGIESDDAYNHINNALIISVKSLFLDNLETGFATLICVLDELYTKLEAIHDGKASAYRMYTINMLDDELTLKRNKLTKLIYGSLSPYWKYNSILTKEKLIRGEIE